MARCSVPKLLGIGDWFDKTFGPLCLAHDDEYVAQLPKLASDWKLCKGMWDMEYRALSIITMFFCLTVGSWFYYRRRFRGVSR